MKIKFSTLALVVATATAFGEQSSVFDATAADLADQSSSLKRSFTRDRKSVADIVVIGAGTAGCVLLKELSEGGRFSVLGLGAGKNPTTDPAIAAVGLPAFQLAQTGRPQYFWPGWSQTLPMTGLNGRTSDWTAGMILGGDSSVNGLYYGRGSNAVYSQWQAVSGSANWSLANISATFTALENYSGLLINPGARGVNGPVNVLQTPTVAQITSQVLLPATQAAFPGIPTALDYNDPSVENCLDPRTQWLIDPSGTLRVSSATAFLGASVMTPEGEGVFGRKLLVRFDAVATQINFNKKGIAKSVEYMQDGELRTVLVRKAVVLAAGINSSKLLQLSGIGPSQALQDAGITPVFINENVGKNLKNHPLLSISMLADPAISGIPAGATYAYTIHNVYLPVVGGSASDPRMLQILFDFIPASAQTPALLNMRVVLVNPRSTGTTTIQSNNPFQLSAVDDGFYQNPVDLENMKNAVKTYVRGVLDQLGILYPFPSPYFKPLVNDPINLVILSGYDDAVVEAYVKNNTNLSQDTRRYTSHCKMAPLADGGVVDGNTLVYGTKNVFVADESICPVMPDNDTTAAAMMIGLRSSIILKDLLNTKK